MTSLNNHGEWTTTSVDSRPIFNDLTIGFYKVEQSAFLWMKASSQLAVFSAEENESSLYTSL